MRTKLANKTNCSQTFLEDRCLVKKTQREQSEDDELEQTVEDVKAQHPLQHLLQVQQEGGREITTESEQLANEDLSPWGPTGMWSLTPRTARPDFQR